VRVPAPAVHAVPCGQYSHSRTAESSQCCSTCRRRTLHGVLRHIREQRTLECAPRDWLLASVLPLWSLLDGLYNNNTSVVRLRRINLACAAGIWRLSSSSAHVACSSACSQPRHSVVVYPVASNMQHGTACSGYCETACCSFTGLCCVRTDIGFVDRPACTSKLAERKRKRKERDAMPARADQGWRE
jgi:hypothetical protein